jgi:hypothetical protein
VEVVPGSCEVLNYHEPRLVAEIVVGGEDVSLESQRHIADRRQHAFVVEPLAGVNPEANIWSEKAARAPVVEVASIHMCERSERGTSRIANEKGGVHLLVKVPGSLVVVESGKIVVRHRTVKKNAPYMSRKQLTLKRLKLAGSYENNAGGQQEGVLLKLLRELSQPGAEFGNIVLNQIVLKGLVAKVCDLDLGM